MPWSPLNPNILLPILEEIKQKERISIGELRQLFVRHSRMLSVKIFSDFIKGLEILGIIKRENNEIFVIDQLNLQKEIEFLKRKK